MTIKFVLDVSESRKKLLKVKMNFMARQAVVSMPVWAPGSYLVRDYAKNLSLLKVENGEIRQIDKSSWEVKSETEEIALSYSIFAEDLSVQGTYADDSLVLVNGTSTFMYPDDMKEETYQLEIVGFGNNNISTGLLKEGKIFKADNYDNFVDSPILISNHSIYKFSALGKEHTIAIHGKLNHDGKKFVEDVKNIVISEGTMFGSLPYSDYTFIFVLLPDDISGGLEHKNSTVIISNEQNILKEFEYKVFLSVVSHEFFHTWNVKRIRPRELGPFDYSKENYTDMLWLSEGFTSYYEWIMLYRAGIIDEKSYFDHLAEMINYYRFLPGHNTSASYSSFNTWTKLYKPTGDLMNNYISYYLKGELIAFVLNAQMLKESGGKKSLDDVFRSLYLDFINRKSGIIYSEFKEFVNSTLGKKMDEFVDSLVQSNREIDFEKYLDILSYSSNKSYYENRKSPDATLGMVLQNSGGKYTVSLVLKDFPAYEAGVNSGDEIVSVNGVRFSDTYIREFSKEMKRTKIDVLKESKPGDEIILHVFRKNILKEFHMNAVEETKWLNLEKRESNSLVDKMLKG